MQVSVKRTRRRVAARLAATAFMLAATATVAGTGSATANAFASTSTPRAVASGPTFRWQILTTDPGTRGGIGQYFSQDTFKACDAQADGLRVWAQASWGGSGFPLHATIEDANGAGTCTTGHTNSLPSGVPIRLEVCLRDGSTGPLRYCTTKTATV